MKTLMLFLLILLGGGTPARAGLPGFMLAQQGTLTGKVELPVPFPKAGVFVSFFNVESGPPPTSTSVRRVPDMLVRSNPEGVFEVQLLPGKYYLGALIRDPAAGPGPPRPGEQFFFALDGEGKLFTPQVRTKETTTAGAVRFATPEDLPDLKDSFAVEGVISDEKGPVEGAVVLVKTDIGQSRPLFISKPTGKDGSFQLQLPAGKTYYLLARQSVEGRRPMPGTYVGTYGKTPPQQGEGPESIGTPANMAGSGGEGEALAITAKPGEKRTGINITMFRIPDPEENRAKFQKEGAPERQPVPAEPPRPQP